MISEASETPKRAGIPAWAIALLSGTSGLCLAAWDFLSVAGIKKGLIIAFKKQTYRAASDHNHGTCRGTVR